MAFEVISVKQLKEMIGKPEYVIVDLRSQRDYKKGHVPGAVNVPFEQIEQGRFSFARNKKLVLYCERGAASFLAARKLHDEGYKACTVVGGYSAIQK